MDSFLAPKTGQILNIVSKRGIVNEKATENGMWDFSGDGNAAGIADSGTFTVGGSGIRGVGIGTGRINYRKNESQSSANGGKTTKHGNSAR